MTKYKHNKKVIGIIPARGGSKGVRRKNLKMVAGRPLLAWTIEQAKAAKYFDRFILSSEDAEIIAAARKLGCEAPFVRPRKLAGDGTHTIDVVLHALRKLSEKYDYVVLLQPTSPLRQAEDIDGCIELCMRKNADSCVSVVEAGKSLYWSFSLDQKNRLKPVLNTGKLIPRRQELPKAYTLNGAVYCARVDWLFKKKMFITDETIAFVMPPERSLDIDSELDLKIVDCLLGGKK
ncbi:acylneuraminate cytidylyltransferase family protein [Candidatus Saganbacteria bacterium]|nr:acylneuraminate cytidylyltransferase family protein [Candidatus Saganbacteria bacterium]